MGARHLLFKSTGKLLGHTMHGKEATGGGGAHAVGPHCMDSSTYLALAEPLRDESI